MEEKVFGLDEGERCFCALWLIIVRLKADGCVKASRLDSSPVALV